jgi:solute carrier family 25 protein 39/40
MTVPSQVTYMTCYDSFRQYFFSLDKSPLSSSNRPSFSNVSTHTLVASLTSGALARGISATLVTPLELLRTRLQASSSNSTSRNLSAILVELGGQVKAQGPKVLFRGLVPTLYRDVPFSAIYFAGYESMKRCLTGAGLGERNSGDSRAKEFGVAFASGSSSGILAAIVTHPFDLIKTRLQAEAAASKDTQRGTLQMWKQIVARDGTPGLFRGLSPRVAKVAPACGIMIASFEFIGRWLEENM